MVFLPYFTCTVSGSDGTFCPRYFPVLQVICLPNDRLRKERFKCLTTWREDLSEHVTPWKRLTLHRGTPPRWRRCRLWSQCPGRLLWWWSWSRRLPDPSPGGRPLVWGPGQRRWLDPFNFSFWGKSWCRPSKYRLASCKTRFHYDVPPRLTWFFPEEWRSVCGTDHYSRCKWFLQRVKTRNSHCNALFKTTRLHLEKHVFYLTEHRRFWSTDQWVSLII